MIPAEGSWICSPSCRNAAISFVCKSNYILQCFFAFPLLMINLFALNFTKIQHLLSGFTDSWRHLQLSPLAAALLFPHK